MTVIYDSGVFIAADRDDRHVWADHRARLEAGLVPLTTATVVAQVSRSPRQAQLRRFLRGCAVQPFRREEAHEVGALLARAGTADVVDAHLVLVAERTHSAVRTADEDDIRRLSEQLLAPIEVLPVSGSRP